MTASTPTRTDSRLGVVERLLDALGDAVVVLDLQGVVRHVNPAAAFLLDARVGGGDSQLARCLGDAVVPWLRAALCSRATADAGEAPPARLLDGRRARLALYPLERQCFALQITPLEATRPRDPGPWFEFSPIGLAIIDATGAVLRCNSAFNALVGPMPPRLRDAEPALRDLLGWGARAPDAALKPGAPALVRHALVPLGDGTLRSLRSSVQCTPATAGPWCCLVAIEDRTLADEHVLMQAQLRALIDSTGVALAAFHPALGRLRSVGAAQAAAGEESLAVGRDVVDADSQLAFERVQRALRRCDAAQARYAVHHADIGTRWLSTRVEPVLLGSGDRAAVAVTVDETAQQLAEAQIESLKRALTSTLEGIPEAVALLGGATLERCNASFANLIGAPANDLAGQTLDRLATSYPVARELFAVVRRSFGGGPLFETELTLRTDDGVARHLSLSLRQPPGAGPDAVAMLVVADITRLVAQRIEHEAVMRERELMFGLSEVGTVYLYRGRIDRVNDAMTRLSGLTTHELIGREHAALFADSADDGLLDERRRQSLAEQGQWIGERRLRCADGTLTWVKACEQLLTPDDVDGRVVASFVSVDDRRRAQESLLLQSERMRAILDSVLVGVVTLSDAGIEWMNRSARRMFGGDLADFFGHALDLVATDDAQHPFRRAKQLLAELDEGQSHTFECEVRARDGRVFWVAGNAVLTGREANGRQLTWALLDIDRRRQAEARIAQAQASLQRIIEAAPMAIVLRDARTLRVTQANQVAAHAIGRSVEDMLGRTPEELYPETLAASMRADAQAALEAGEGADLRRETIFPALPERGIGQRVWEARFLPLAAHAGEAPDQLLVVATDVTEQRAAEAARLEHVIAQREMLINEIHHRIKNNLQGVAGLLQQAAQRRPEVAPALAEAVGQVQAIAQVYGLQVGASGPLRVKNVVETIATSVQRMFGRPITLRVEGESAHRWALPEAESIPIALAINELLTNAVKHGAEGDVLCTVTCGASDVVIAIANHGALPPDFDIGSVRTGVSGIGLVRALLPRRCAQLDVRQRDADVVASIVLAPPGLTRLEPL